MSILVVFLAVFASALAQGEHNHNMHMVNVAVYYEALCPDSIKFFTTKLYPSLHNGNISQYINLTLVPYGKSKMIQENGQLKFECHHGEGECRGNKLQACALKLIEGGKNSEGLGYNKITTAFINCLMDKVENKKDDTKYPTEECTKFSGVTNIKDIESCQTNPEASEYLAELGNITEKLNPKLQSVPYIVFNNQQNDDNSKLANEDFVKALCQHIHTEKPAECTRSSAHFARISFVALILVVVGYFF